MFSQRLPSHLEVNPITRRLEQLRAHGAAIIDLTGSNPTTAGFTYPPDLLAALSSERSLHYDPQPLGLASARAAVAEDYRRRGRRVDPDHMVLCASTSEAYSWLFKLLCNPGESVLVPRPSYPLFEHLTSLDAVRTVAYDLRYHGRWEIDFATVASDATARAVLVVSPNNPTGSYVSAHEVERLSAHCRERDLPLIVDEVFDEYALETSDRTATLPDDILSFTLGGASKSLGLPQVKLGWIVVGGPAVVRMHALHQLELIADTFLSVATPVQVAAPELFRRAATVRRDIHARVRHNLSQARDIARRHPACDVLRVEGGWSAVVRIPATRREEAFVLELLEREHLLVHPGYFFDFPHEAFVVVSLLTPTDVFVDAFDRMLSVADS